MKKVFLLLICTASLLAQEISYEEERAVVVLGGGVGALTSATYLARAGLDPLVISGPVPGGALLLTHSIQNWPGEVDISGAALVEKLTAQALSNGAALLPETVIDIDLSSRPFTITTTNPYLPEKRHIIKAHTCLIALGASPNLLNVPGENHYFAKGVSTCAVCDGSLYRDKEVAIAGGGDSSLTEAIYLSSLAKKVYLLVRGSSFSSSDEKKVQQVQALSNVEILFETTVTEIRGDGRSVHSLMLHSPTKKSIAVEALFLAIGSKPNSSLFEGKIELDSRGYIVLKKGQQTSRAGLFAIGDIADPEFKQAVTAAGDGAKASIQIQKEIATLPKKVSSPSKETSLCKSSVLEISSEEELTRALHNSSRPVFLYFYSSHCAPCRSFSLLFNSWSQEWNTQFSFIKINTGTFSSLARRYQIQSIPTVILFNAEKEPLFRATSMQDRILLNRLLEKKKREPSFSNELFYQEVSSLSSTN